MKKELQPLKSGGEELEQALHGIKVCNASPESLISILRRVMLLVGLRAANLPSPEETQILTAFIFKKYAGLTLTEIQLAFEKAVAGELECEANCYENFSCAYFGQIMAAYKKWASQMFNENQMYVIKPQEQNLLTMPADWKELCEYHYQRYLNSSLVISLMPWQLYDEFVKCEMMHEDAYHVWLKDAYFYIVRRENDSNNDKGELLRDVRDKGINHPHVADMAKRLAVEFLYKTAKEKNYTHLFIKE